METHVNGVTVAICSHNGAERIASALSHLTIQTIVQSLPWEVLIVDNASADSTSHAARAAWDERVAPMRVLAEPRLGLAHARRRALDEARYDIVSFVDDDNWVARNWVQRVASVMTAHPSAAVLGGRVVGRFEQPPPRWLDAFHEDLAVGPQAPGTGDITARGYVWGAGMTIRREAWLHLCEAGFSPRLPDRCGVSLSGGGDVELCLALRRSGWRLRYDEDLVLTHFVERRRMQADYIRRLHRGHGRSSVVLESAGLAPGQLAWWRRSRVWQFGSVVRALARFMPAAIRTAGQAPSHEQLQFEFALGRLSALCGVGAHY